MTPFICRTCGVQHAPSVAPRTACAICEDERQYVGADGQRWTTIEELDAERTTHVVDVEPGLWAIETRPGFAIGQRAYIVQTSTGNLMWESISTITEAAVARVHALGGVRAIAISHPHFYSSMVEWARALGDVPIWLHQADRNWVMRADPLIRHWDGPSADPIPGSGLTLVNTGGHFEGMTGLLWPEGAEGQGAFFGGDIPQIVPDGGWVSFMYSYPNLIPLSAGEVSRIANLLHGYRFDRLYGSWPNRVIDHDARGAIARSAERYRSALGR